LNELEKIEELKKYIDTKRAAPSYPAGIAQLRG
jgi:hypothetical protein